jgi:LuxR family maltose regulon positive regulatory protein
VTAGRQQVGADLTRRELKILKLLAVRLSNVEISEELCISRATVKRHTQNIYRKLHASSRREAVVRARTLNILVDG